MLYNVVIFRRLANAVALSPMAVVFTARVSLTSEVAGSAVGVEVAVRGASSSVTTSGTILETKPIMSNGIYSNIGSIPSTQRTESQLTPL